MNVIEYDRLGKAGIRLTDTLLSRLCDTDAKYIRFNMKTEHSSLSYHIEMPEGISSDDYVIRLESSTNLVMSGQVYSKLYGNCIGVKEGLKGTELYCT